MMDTEEPRRRRSPRPRRRVSESGHPSGMEAGAGKRQLIHATIAAIVVAAIILVVAVLPAEYGIDPTGAGDALGLTKMAATSERAPSADEFAVTGDQVQTAQQSAASADVVSKTEIAMRSDSMSVTLQPGQGAEVKAKMMAGERLVFEWASAGGPVNFDMHGEEPNAGERFTSYWADKQKDSAAGVFVAPVEGTHGWFWRNRGDGPVEVTVKTSGFYEKLYRVK